MRAGNDLLSVIDLFTGKRDCIFYILHLIKKLKSIMDQTYCYCGLHCKKYV